jgi:hypothetical protein
MEFFHRAWNNYSSCLPRAGTKLSSTGALAGTTQRPLQRYANRRFGSLRLLRQFSRWSENSSRESERLVLDWNARLRERCCGVSIHIARRRGAAGNLQCRNAARTSAGGLATCRSSTSRRPGSYLVYSNLRTRFSDPMNKCAEDATEASSSASANSPLMIVPRCTVTFPPSTAPSQALICVNRPPKEVDCIAHAERPFVTTYQASPKSNGAPLTVSSPPSPTHHPSIAGDAPAAPDKRVTAMEAKTEMKAPLLCFAVMSALRAAWTHTVGPKHLMVRSLKD